MTFDDLTPEFLSERATKEDIFEVDGTRFSAIYNEGLNVFKLFYVDRNDDEWVEVYFADEEEGPAWWEVLRYEDKIENEYNEATDDECQV